VPFRTRIQAAAAAHDSWWRTIDRSARTKPARDALLAKFEREVDPAGLMSPADRRKAAEDKRRTHLVCASQMGVAARRAKARPRTSVLLIGVGVLTATAHMIVTQLTGASALPATTRKRKSVATGSGRRRRP
jgi:hypothetical protein